MPVMNKINGAPFENKNQTQKSGARLLNSGKVIPIKGVHKTITIKNQNAPHPNQIKPKMVFSSFIRVLLNKVE